MFRKGFIIVSIGILAATFAGCGGGGGGSTTSSSDTTGPTITNAAADAPDDSSGGSVNFSATVTDAGGVKSVTAVVTAPNATKSPLLSMSGNGSSYTGIYPNAAENTGPYAVTYTMVLTAKDMAGNTTTKTITFEVPGETPPAHP